MKLFVALVMAIFAFAATIAGALYLAGGFTQEGMQKLLGIEAPKAQEAALPSEEQIPEVVKALNERDKELTEREEALKTEEKRVEETRAQLASLRDTLQGLVEEATKSLDQADSDKQQRLQTVADSLGAMAANEPVAAASVLEAWLPKDAAIVLQMIDEEMRGEILTAMKADRSAAILSAMKEVSALAAPVQQ